MLSCESREKKGETTATATVNSLEYEAPYIRLNLWNSSFHFQLVGINIKPQVFYPYYQNKSVQIQIEGLVSRLALKRGLKGSWLVYGHLIEIPLLQFHDCQLPVLPIISHKDYIVPELNPKFLYLTGLILAYEP